MTTPLKSPPHRFPPSEAGLRTLAIHAGESPDPATRASAPNLVMSTTFVVDADAAFSAEAMGDETRWVYTRWGNPTVHQLELKLAALEGADTAVAFGSGMAALFALLLHTLKSGDHAVISDVAYAALSESANEVLPELGISVTRADTSDPENVRHALTPRTRLVHIETPNNPILRLTDIAAVAAIAHANGALLSVDSTFATPAATRPLALGADFVVHSLTKYLGGHGDALGHHRSLLFYLGTNDLLQTTFKLDAAQLASWRTFAGDGLFRFSVGLEDPEDLIADLEQAFSHL